MPFEENPTSAPVPSSSPDGYDFFNEQDTQGDDQFSDADKAAAILQEYWALEQEGEKLWATLKDKEQEFFEAFERRGLLVMARLVYGMYFGLSGSSGVSSEYQTQTIRFSGEDGELLEFSINEIRSFFDQIFNMTTRNRPAFQAQAVNTDYASLAQVESADSTVQYYYEQVFGERKEKEAVKLEGMYGKSYIHIEWDPDGGPEIEVDDTIPSPNGELPATKKVKAGEFIINKHYPWDVVCEPYRSEYVGHLWRMVIPPARSKFEMIARFPLYAEQIQKAQPEENPYFFKFPGSDPQARQPEDLCSLRIFYHVRNAACPEGRKCLFVNGVMVQDEPLPIDEIPVIPLMSCELHGTSFGISDLWNLIPLEQMQNQVMSDMATNIEAFGRPPLLLPEGTDIDLDALANGQKVLFLPPNVQTPEPIKFPQVPDISFKVVQLLREFKQSLSGLNAIARGDTNSNVTSGAHAALYSQIAVDAQSPRAVELDLLRERVANQLLMYLKKYAQHPQLVAITGVDERSYLQEMTKEDFSGVHRVVIKSCNPMLKTTAGKMQLAEVLRDWPGQPLKDPAQIVELVTSGQLKPSYNVERVMELSVRRENELLLKGPPVQELPGEVDPTTGMQGPPKKIVPAVPVYATDNAAKHLIGHLQVLYSPAAANNPAIRDAVLAHLLNHTDVARGGDPYLAQLLGNPPPYQAAPPGGPPDKGQPGSPDQGAGANGSGPTEGTQKASADVLAKDDSKGGLPSPAKPAEQPGPQ